MTFEEIIMLIVAAAPSVISIISIIISVVKMITAGKINNKQIIEKFDEVRQEMVEKKQYDELKNQLEAAWAEVHKTHKLINELLTKKDKIERKEE